MKFSAAIVALALAATATAQKIAISNPTKGSKWEVGKPQQLMWSGNCASMGANAGNVSVQIVNGPASSVQFKGEIGKLDCSGSLTNTIVTIGTDIESGEYSIRVLTLPEPSYSPAFDVVNAALPGTPTATTGAPKPATTTGTGSGASKVVAGSMALAGVVAAMLL